MYIIGAGGHAKVILDILDQNERLINGIFDDNLNAKTFIGYPLIGKTDKIKNNYNEPFIIAIGNNSARKKISQSLNVKYGTAIASSASISKSVSIADGTVVMNGVSINAASLIGQHAIINTNASVDHDCSIGDFVHISPNAALAGNVTVGEGSHIGIGAAIIQGIKIGKWVTVGAGTIIIKDVPDYAVIVGNPGKIIKYNTISHE